MDKELNKYITLIKDYVNGSYTKNFREPLEGIFRFPYLVPGANYSHQLWDWDSWLTGYALMGIKDPKVEEYQKGCILNFLDHVTPEGMMPILIQNGDCWFQPQLKPGYMGNIHKPCLAIHAYEICKRYGNVEWIRDSFDNMLRFISWYETNQYDAESGLYYWINDLAIGFDNDPTVFYRPNKSTGAIYLNSLMYSELDAIANIAKLLGRDDVAKEYEAKANSLKTAIQNECFDKVDGFFYSADLSLRKVDPNERLHSGHPRFWHSLPIKITTWAGMLPLWNKVATQEQADKAVKHMLLEDSLWAPYGVRSVAKNEKMYGIFDTGNPSCWLGPIWINASYMTYIGLKNYGYDELAKELAVKTITMLGKDIEGCGEFHEYYDGDTGLGVRGKGFQSWNFLVIRMIEDLENGN